MIDLTNQKFVLDAGEVVAYNLTMNARLRMCCCSVAREIPGAFVCTAFRASAH